MFRWLNYGKPNAISRISLKTSENSFEFTNLLDNSPSRMGCFFFSLGLPYMIISWGWLTPPSLREIQGAFCSPRALSACQQLGDGWLD